MRQDEIVDARSLPTHPRLRARRRVSVSCARARCWRRSASTVRRARSPCAPSPARTSTPRSRGTFVFGEASLDERVGVFSFASYEPSSPRFVRRCLDVLAHETGHVFGLVHCVYYACIMNGSKTLEESDRQPSHLCPVCLRKLQWATGFDVRARYADLEAVYRGADLENEARWTRERISALDAP